MDSLIESPWNTTERRLRMTFSVALALHLIFLIGLSFSVSTTPTQTHALEVTLALTPSDQTPDEADFIAQTSQLGSGDQANAMQPTTDYGHLSNPPRTTKRCLQSSAAQSALILSDW